MYIIIVKSFHEVSIIYTNSTKILIMSYIVVQIDGLIDEGQRFFVSKALATKIYRLIQADVIKRAKKLKETEPAPSDTEITVTKM